MFINGENRILYIKWEGQYLPIGCLTGDSFSESSEMLNTTTRDNAGWSTSVPTTQNYNISFDGLVINTNFTGGDFTKVSYDRLRELKRNRTLIEWKLKDNNNIFVDSGKGYITELSDSSSIDEFISFNASIIGYGRPDETSFTTTWRTTTNNENIIIGLDPSKTYNFLIDWGDGIKETINTSSDLSHNYSQIGDYLVKIDGIFPRILMNRTLATSDKIISINNWGTIEWDSMVSAFSNCSNLHKCNTLDTPDLSKVTSLSSMFKNAGYNSSNLIINNINKWALNNVTNLGNMFNGASSFNEKINDWDVSKVTSMNNMFSGATNFNQPLSNWNVSNVTNMNNMFKNASSFNQNIDTWKIGNLTSLLQLFDGATNFNQPLNSWNTQGVTTLLAMFRDATSFNQPLSNWNVTNVKSTSQMFKGAVSFKQDLNSWETNTNSTTSNIENMSFMFDNATNFVASLNSWDTSSATNISYILRNINDTEGAIDVASWDVSKVTNAQFAFAFNKDGSPYLTNWDVSSMTNIKSMLQGTSTFQFFTDIKQWDISKVTDATSFMGFSGLFAPGFSSTGDYDNILSAFANQSYNTTPINLTIHFGTSRYSNTTGLTARNILTTPVSSGGYGWTITDGGPA
jgi:surface protein